MRYFLNIILLLLFFNEAKSQHFQYENIVIGGNESGIYQNRELAIDKYNNKYVLGLYYQNFSINNNSVSTPKYGLYLAKFNQNEQLEWLQNVASSDTIMPNNFISTDKSGKILIGINYYWPLTTIGPYSVIDSNNYILIKLNENGSLNFVLEPGAKKKLGIAKAYSDENNNIYLAGNLGGYQTGLWNDTIGGVPLHGDKTDIVIAKYDSSGNLLFIKKAASGAGSQAMSFCHVEKGNIYILGYNQSSTSAYFDSIILDYPSGYTLYHKCFIACFDINGNAKWARRFGKQTLQISPMIARGITSRGKNIYFAGLGSDNVQNTFYFQTNGADASVSGVVGGSFDYFIVSYDTLGNYRWSKASNAYSDEYITELASDTNGLVYATGAFGGVSIKMDTDTLYNHGADDAFTACIDSMGNYKWAACAGGAGVESGYGIALDNQNNVYTVGGISSPVAYFGDSTIYPTYSPAMFLAKMVIKIDTATSIRENDKLNYKLYPNPANTSISIEAPIQTIQSIRITDISGKEVFHQKLNSTSSINLIKFSAIPTGIYLIHLIGNGIETTQKLVIE